MMPGLEDGHVAGGHSGDSGVHGHEAGGEHDHGHDHDHSFETAPTPAEAVELDGVEQITLLSAGLDVGSSTSHVSISRLVLRRRLGEMSNQLVVAERTPIYWSPVILTPYRTDTLIDADALDAFLSASYVEVGVEPADIHTGVVIVTGEAANRPNAEQFAERFAARSGTFICVSAGPHYEALLAAHGSFAAGISRRDHSTVLNIDIGGGTTKLSVIIDGEITNTAALSVGARLVAFDPDTRLHRVEPPAQWMLEHLGEPATVGELLPDDLQEQLAELMTDTLFDLVTGKERSTLLSRLWVTEPMAAEALVGVDTIVISGGVSEYVYEHEKADFGDLGRRLGRMVRDRLERDGLAAKLQSPEQGIRATVFGAAEHSVQASGVTSFLDDEYDVLPARGLKVVAATIDTHSDLPGLAADLRAAAERFEVDGEPPGLAYSLVVKPLPDYRLLRGLAEQLVEIGDQGESLFIVLDVDIAQALGRVLRSEFGWSTPMIVVDGLSVGELDYLDIGRPLGPGYTVPVTVKSLTFVTR